MRCPGAWYGARVACSRFGVADASNEGATRACYDSTRPDATGSPRSRLVYDVSMPQDLSWFRSLKVPELAARPLPEPLAGPWGASTACAVFYGSGTRAVLKAWNSTIWPQCKAEHQALAGSLGCDLTPAPLPLAGSLAPLRLNDDTWVTAREFVPGRLFEPGESASLPLLGSAIGRLHLALSGIGEPGVSRLHEVRAHSPRHSLACLEPVLRRAHLALEPYWDKLLRLPATTIHGDPTWANVVAGSDGLRFIDFEFSRHDLRVLDLVPALAGARSAEDGRFVPQPPKTVLEVAAGYAQIAPLTEDELGLLAPAAMAFFVMVAHDVGRTRRPSSFGLEHVLEAALAWTSETVVR